MGGKGKGKAHDLQFYYGTDVVGGKGKGSKGPVFGKGKGKGTGLDEGKGKSKGKGKGKGKGGKGYVSDSSAELDDSEYGYGYRDGKGKSKASGKGTSDAKGKGKGKSKGKAKGKGKGGKGKGATRISPLLQKIYDGWRPDDPVEDDGEWVFHDDFRGKKSYGYFVCGPCTKEWMSAHAFRGYGQDCKRCEGYSLPVLMWQNAPRHGYDPTKKSVNIIGNHDVDRCEAGRAGICDKCAAIRAQQK